MIFWTLRTLILIISFFCIPSFATTQDAYVLNDHQYARFQQLTYELRCLVCQNQNLADSNAPLAIDLRNQIVTMIKANKDDANIKKYLQQRYGDFVLYKPSFNSQTYLLWLGPFALLLIGLAIFAGFVYRKQLR